jgi:hypothetical protein
MIKSRVASSKSAASRPTAGRCAAVVARASSSNRELGSSSSSSADEAEAVRGRRAMLVDSAAMLAAAAAFPAIADDEAAPEAAPVPEAAPAPPAPPPKKAVPMAAPIAQPVMAYEFAYPSENSTGEKIKWATSRVRETYSSAEPMSPDARQRIVYELISFLQGPLTATVTVGPAPPKLAKVDQKEWKPRQIAEGVLADRATGRIASGQKVSLAEVESAKKESIDGVDYVYYEYISQGSPNLQEREATTFRHSVGVTAIRGEYLYTCTFSAPESFWDINSDGFEKAIRSFRLTCPEQKEVPRTRKRGTPAPFAVLRGGKRSIR